ncbi:MAG: YCF48-related protein, partial [Acidobacteriota bacterium]|nr:YCF48-related protein [Acidobacteriota bacterium]
GATLLATNDGGETWRSALRPGGLNASARLNAICFSDGRHGWAVGSGGAVIHTANGGRTWQAQATPTDADLYDVKFLNEREGWAVGAQGTLLHTADGGARWQAESFPTRHPLERLALAAPAHVWAVGFGGIILAQVSAATPPPLQPDQPATRKRRVAN